MSTIKVNKRYPFEFETVRVNEPGFEREPIEDPDWANVANLPMTGVYWDEAMSKAPPGAHEFCDRLSRDTGRKYRLPSEAEWEYACRVGTQTQFYVGPTITSDLANYQKDTVARRSVFGWSVSCLGLHNPCPVSFQQLGKPILSSKTSIAEEGSQL